MQSLALKKWSFLLMRTLLINLSFRCTYNINVFMYPGMPGGGGQYGVMGRHQDPRSSMFGSSLNLNGKHNPIYDNTDLYLLFF